ncbi:MAG: thioesterase family protein [Chlamydiota bacterium]|nr:thioesterase family protein [Chlamydiota bacterium]
MYKTKNRVRMHDVDLADRLYFPRQFRFVHEALEDFMETEGLPFNVVFQEEKFLFVIVHCESDYLAILEMGDLIDINVYVEKIGTTSFTLHYDIFKEDGTKAGMAKTVHVALNKATGTKIPIPEKLKAILNKHLL